MSIESEQMGIESGQMNKERLASPITKRAQLDQIWDRMARRIFLILSTLHKARSTKVSEKMLWSPKYQLCCSNTFSTIASVPFFLDNAVYEFENLSYDRELEWKA